MKKVDRDAPLLPMPLPHRQRSAATNKNAKQAKRVNGKRAPKRINAAKTKKPQPAKSARSSPKQQNDPTWVAVRGAGKQQRRHLSEGVTYVHADALDWISALADNTVHAVVTDPPYSTLEYNETNHTKLRAGRGGVWRIPPSFDGAMRNPVPRFTVLSKQDRAALAQFFAELAVQLERILVPGGHLIIASNPLLSSQTFCAIEQSGFEKRGEIIRLVQTLRGGDRPKNAHQEFPNVSTMARSCWEPWGIFRKPLDGTAAHNLRKWGTGGLRRISDDDPFRDVIECAPTRGKEKKIAPHPSLKPQRFLRQVVRAALPLGTGIIYDPFAGSASTLAAAQAVGYTAIGTERDTTYFEMGCAAFPELCALV